MKTSIETRNGKLVTVIRKSFDAEWVGEQLAVGMPVVAEYLNDGGSTYRKVLRDALERKCYEAQTEITPLYTITILPALPRNPKPEDVPLLYRYASEGLFAHIEGAAAPDSSPGWGVFSGYEPAESAFSAGRFWIIAKAEITHAVDAQGNTQEVAIEGVE